MNKQYVIETCKLGQGEETCAFIVMDGEGFSCGKDQPDLRNVLNLKLAEGSMIAKGNNCWGYKAEMSDA